ncbi:MAG: hypothetical protein HFH14_00315 [Lachnospiraceae bacterium]|nr:hypothetical protein [Lachnospiraceae bacterium]
MSSILNDTQFPNYLSEFSAVTPASFDVNTAAPSQGRIADERIFGRISPEIIWFSTLE